MAYIIPNSTESRLRNRCNSVKNLSRFPLSREVHCPQRTSFSFKTSSEGHLNQNSSCNLNLSTPLEIELKCQFLVSLSDILKYLLKTNKIFFIFHIFLETPMNF